MLTFEEYCQIIVEWKKSGYPFVFDDVIRQKIASFDKRLKKQAKTGDKKAEEQVEYIKNLFETPQGDITFNLRGYLVERLKKLKINPENIMKYTEQIKNEELEFVVPDERLADFYMSESTANGKEALPFRKNIEQIINKLCTASQYSNRVLAGSLKEHSIIIRCEKGKFNACMGVCVKDGTVHPVLWIRCPDFKKSINVDLLAATIGHELGHWLDFGYRPRECMVESGLMQECFADVVGCQLVQNAGYNVKPFMARIHGFIQDFDKKPEFAKYRRYSEMREELLQRCFGKKQNMLFLKMKKEGPFPS